MNDMVKFMREQLAKETPENQEKIKRVIATIAKLKWPEHFK